MFGCEVVAFVPRGWEESWLFEGYWYPHVWKRAICGSGAAAEWHGGFSAERGSTTEVVVQKRSGCLPELCELSDFYYSNSWGDASSLEDS